VLNGLFGSTTLPALLRGGLEETTATHRGIASRVAGLLTSSSATTFQSELEARAAQAKHEEDLQREMSALADTQLRYEADAKLLQSAYARLRTAMKSHA
jgi:flagellar basal body rod protein FlgB